MVEKTVRTAENVRLVSSNNCSMWKNSKASKPLPIRSCCPSDATITTRRYYARVKPKLLFCTTHGGAVLENQPGDTFLCTPDAVLVRIDYFPVERKKRLPPANFPTTASRCVAHRDEACMIPKDVKTRIRSLAREALGCRLCGEYHRAEALYAKALGLGEQALEETDVELAWLSNDAAVLYKYTGRFDDARRLYLRALKTFKRSSKADPLSLATVYHNVGGLEHARGRYKRAEAFARRSVVIREKAMGPDHPATAADVAALGAILEGQQQYDEAEQLYRRALAIFERTFGPDYYEIAVNLNNLATLS
jgi:tetratricopeptide (TPR) repeat protein